MVHRHWLQMDHLVSALKCVLCELTIAQNCSEVCVNWSQFCGACTFVFIFSFPFFPTDC